MTPAATFALLVAAGAALVAQNLLMARITGAASSVLVALMMNSAVGLVALSVLLLGKAGMNGATGITGMFRPWFVIPGLLGTFFVFASITGYRELGAAPTISILVASQLAFGLAWDMSRSETVSIEGLATAAGGAALIVAGVVMIASRHG